jgi:hypothetical protein
MKNVALHLKNALFIDNFAITNFSILLFIYGLYNI